MMIYTEPWFNATYIQSNYIILLLTPITVILIFTYNNMLHLDAFKKAKYKSNVETQFRFITSFD